MFGAVTLAKNTDLGKHGYSDYGTGRDARSQFPLLIDGWGNTNIVIFGGDNSSSRHIDNGKKYPNSWWINSTDQLNDTTITTKAEYSVNITKSRKKICLSLHYNASNSVLYTKGMKIYQLKAMDFKIRPYPLCLGNSSNTLLLIIWKN